MNVSYIDEGSDFKLRVFSLRMVVKNVSRKIKQEATKAGVGRTMKDYGGG